MKKFYYLSSLFLVFFLFFFLQSCINSSGCEANADIQSNHFNDIPHTLLDEITNDEVEFGDSQRYQFSFGGNGDSLADDGHSHFFEILSEQFEDIRKGEKIEVDSSECSQNCGFFGSHFHLVNVECTNREYIEDNSGNQSTSIQ